MRSLPSTICIAVAMAFVLALGGCSDPIQTTPVNGGSANSGGSGGSNGSDDDDVGDDDVEDVEDDADAGPEECEYDPDELSADDRYPCCFTDQDCHDSDAEGAVDMNCYYSECEEGGQGICRTAPEDGDCWSDDDCDEGQSCPHETDADLFDCQDATVFEAPEQCLDD